MGEGSFKGVLLSVLITVLLLAIAIPLQAKPIAPNPGLFTWDPAVWWGTKLRLENIFVAEAWFGEGVADSAHPGIPGVTCYMVVFAENGSTYAKRTYPSAPMTYQVWMYKFGATSTTAEIKSEIENATHLFVPQDYSVVLDNSAEGIHVNLKKENGIITGLGWPGTKAALYVDNAVDIMSIENLDPLIGGYGETLRLKVTVKNTGRYSDNYDVSIGGTLDPILSLNPLTNNETPTGGFSS